MQRKTGKEKFDLKYNRHFVGASTSMESIGLTKILEQLKDKGIYPSEFVHDQDSKAGEIFLFSTKIFDWLFKFE